MNRIARWKASLKISARKAKNPIMKRYLERFFTVELWVAYFLFLVGLSALIKTGINGGSTIENNVLPIMMSVAGALDLGGKFK